MFRLRVAVRLHPTTPAIPQIPRAKIYKAVGSNRRNAPIGGACVPAAVGRYTVKVADTAPAIGITVCGLNVQLPAAGKPAQVKPTACLNPFLGATVTVRFPEDPGAMESDELLIVNEKSPAAAFVTVTINAVEVDAA